MKHFSGFHEFTDIQEIARNSKSVVWKAKLDTMPVAIKQIHTELAIYEKQVEHIFNEKEILEILTESNIPGCCKLHGTFKMTDSVCLVLQYIEGRVLTECAMDENMARHILKQIIVILQTLKDQGIVYRDLKLTNLIVDEGGQVTLIDFGLSKKINQSKTYSICGTAHAMSPELVVPLDSGYSFEVDCWALGVLMFEIFEYRAPFGYDRSEEDFHLSPTCLSFRRIPKNSILTDLISRLLTVSVNDRYSIEDVAKHPWFQDPSSGEDDEFWDSF